MRFPADPLLLCLLCAHTQSLTLPVPGVREGTLPVATRSHSDLSHELFMYHLLEKGLPLHRRHHQSGVPGARERILPVPVRHSADLWLHCRHHQT